MRTLGLAAIYPKPDTSAAHPQHKVYPYSLRNIKASYPNHIRGTDITYIRMQGGFMYLAGTVRQAGSGYINTLLTAGVNISMDGRGRCMDDIFTERLLRTVKYEDVYIKDVYIKDYAMPRELRCGLNNFFVKYNSRRGRQSLDYKTPEEVYFGELVSAAATPATAS